LPGTAQNKRSKESHEFTRLLLGKADMRVVWLKHLVRLPQGDNRQIAKKRRSLLSSRGPSAHGPVPWGRPGPMAAPDTGRSLSSGRP